MSSSLIWFDNLDREVLRAEYGTDIEVLSHVDPRNLAPGWSLTSQNIADILISDQLLSLTQTIYNARGLVHETRDYNVINVEDIEYFSTKTFYDHKDQSIEVHSMNSPIQRSVYNAKGQLLSVSSSVIIDDEYVEIMRTNTTYDDENQAIKNIMWERLHNATRNDLVLNDSNSVITYSYTWYNESGRVIATANFGTNHTDDVYCNAYEEPAYDPDNPPEISSNGPQVTKYEYDESGSQNATHNPDGTVTRTEFDDLGREILMTENANDRDADGLLRHTANYYDGETGLLMKMAAVLPDHVGFDGDPGIGNWSDINWSRSDGSLQVTEMIYNGNVVDNDKMALNFDGNNDYVEIPDLNHSNFPENFTISLWIKADNTKVHQSVISMSDSLGSGWIIFLKDETILFTANTTISEGNEISLSSEFKDTDMWHHVVVMYNVTEENRNASLFLDGKLMQSSEDGSIIPIVYNNNVNLTFGCMASNPDHWFRGQIEEVVIFNRSISFDGEWIDPDSITEFELLFRDPGCSEATDSAIGYWKLNESNGDIAIDRSGNEYDGTIVGASWFGRVISCNAQCSFWPR